MISQLKKVYSDLSNAVKLAEIENGTMDNWEFPSDNEQALETFLLKYYTPYLKGAKLIRKIKEFPLYNPNGEISGGINMRANFGILMNNGTILGFFNHVKNDGISQSYQWIFADLNGYKGPNKLGRDVFVFEGAGYNTKTKTIQFWNYKLSLDDLMNKKQYGCNKNGDNYSGFNCGAAIQKNDWKLPDNYPWR